LNDTIFKTDDLLDMYKFLEAGAEHLSLISLQSYSPKILTSDFDGVRT